MTQKFRQTAEIVRSGQPRPYADTELVIRVTFERTSFRDNYKDFVPDYMDHETALRKLKSVLGYTTRKRNEDGDWFATYLEYVKPLDTITSDKLIPNGDPKTKLHSTWEFKTVAPFTD